MQRLMQVGGEMDQKAQGFPARPVALPAIGQHAHMFFDLGHDAIVAGAITSCVIGAGGERDIDIVPGTGVAAPVAYLIGPV